MRKRISLSYLILVVFLMFVVPFSYSDIGGEQGTEGELTQISNPDQASQLAQSGGEATFQQNVQFNSPHDSKVDVKSGTSMYSDGQSLTFDSKDTITEDSNSYTDVEN